MTHKEIRINGDTLPGDLMIEDPDARNMIIDTNGQRRHVRSYRTPAGLRRYLTKHPEGLIVAGCGVFLFREPAAVTAARIRYDESGNVNILIPEKAEEIRRELENIAQIREAAAYLFNMPPGTLPDETSGQS